MNENLLSISWNNYGSALIYSLQNFFMKESYCDATVICEGRHIKVHKIVLSACSEYFRELFDNISCFHPFIVLKDVSLSDFKALLEYMYNGKTCIFKNRFSKFINTADYFRVQGLSVSNNDLSSSVKISNASSENLSNLCKNLVKDMPESCNNEVPRIKCNNFSAKRNIEKLCVFGMKKLSNSSINKVQNNYHQSYNNFAKNKIFNTCSKEINMASKPVVILHRNEHLKRVSRSNVCDTQNIGADEDELRDVAVNNTNVSPLSKLSSLNGSSPPPPPQSDANPQSLKVSENRKQNISFFTEENESNDRIISRVINQSSNEDILEQMEESEIPFLDGESKLGALKCQEFRHKCLECGFSAKFPVQLREHAKTHDVPTSKRYKCGMCSFSTNMKRHLTRHVKSHKKTRKCKNCSFVASLNIALKKHEDTCKKESLNVEQLSSKEALDEDELPNITTTASDRDSHCLLGDNYFQCAFCPHTTSSENLLTNHVKKNHS